MLCVPWGSFTLLFCFAMSAQKYHIEIFFVLYAQYIPNCSWKLPSVYTCDPLQSRAALHTALWCKYTQPCSFAWLCSEDGGLAGPRLRLVFTDTICNRHVRAKRIMSHLFGCITVVCASQKECYLKQNRNFAGLCAIRRAVRFRHSFVQFGRTVRLGYLHWIRQTTLRTVLTWAEVNNDLCIPIESRGDN